MPNPAPRLKKSETLEIRLPYPTKLAFMARCRDEGRTASEALRGFIEGSVDGRRSRKTARTLVAGALVAAAVGAVALPSLARQAATAAEFARVDANHDGVITYAEFRAARR